MNLNNLHLRALKEKDAALMLKWLCDKETTKNFTFGNKNFTLADAQEFIKKSVLSGEFVFAVCDKGDEYLGTVSITRRENIPMLAIALRKKARGQGAGEFAVKTAARKYFEQSAERKIYLNVYEDNLAAIKLYEKCDFKKISKIDFARGKKRLWYCLEKQNEG